MTDDVFNQDPPVQDPAQTTPDPQAQPQDVFTDQLASIKNEDGTPKYSDVATALASIQPAQTHIVTIETENADLKTQLAEEKAAKELLAKQVGKPETPAPQGITAEQVAEIALKAQQDAQQANTEAANVAAVNAKFSELYGAKAQETMQKVAQESGMSIASVHTLAKSSPQAVFRLAGITAPQPAPVPKTPGVGSGDNFTPPKPTEPPKSVMGGSDTKSLVANWHAAGEAIKQQNQ